MSSFFGCCLRGGADDDAGPATGIHHLEQTGLGSLDRLHPMLGEAVELWLFDNDLEGELDPALAAGRKLELLYLNGNSLVEIADATAAKKKQKTTGVARPARTEPEREPGAAQAAHDEHGVDRSAADLPQRSSVAERPGPRPRRLVSAQGERQRVR